MKIYNELESLGFFEWLKEKGFGSGFTAMILDAQPFYSIERTGYNSIAFRWFREKYDLLGYVNDESSVEDNPNIHKKWMYVIQELPIVLHDDLSNGKIYKTYEEAELECLKKLIEICKDENIRKSP